MIRQREQGWDHSRRSKTGVLALGTKGAPIRFTGSRLARCRTSSVAGHQNVVEGFRYRSSPPKLQVSDEAECSMSSASQLLARFNANEDLRRLLRSDLPVDTLQLARYLVGKVIVHDTTKGRISGRIVETEAYPVGDAAGHAFRGMTPRNSSLFLERGHAYVYLVYGVSFLLNVTSERAGVGAGVLLRAIEPLDGLELMDSRPRKKQSADLGKGPGRLTKAMQVDLRHDGLDLCNAGSPLWLAATRRKTGTIGKSVRIGLTHGAGRLLRFYERGNKYISGPKRLLKEYSK